MTSTPEFAARAIAPDVHPLAAGTMLRSQARVLASVLLLSIGALLALCTVFLAGGCASLPREIPVVARAQVAEDFGTYSIQRVGLMPFGGALTESSQAQALQQSLAEELRASTPYEIVPMTAGDLEEVRGTDAYRLGWYRRETIIELARRYQLDALVFGTVVQQQNFPPLRFSMQVDLVASETGVPIWSSQVQLDAADERVRQGLQLYFGGRKDDSGQPGWELALLAPNRFARFAAWQVASLL